LLKDNVISYKLLSYLETKEFVKREKIFAFKQKIIDFYAEHFSKGNRKKAIKKLESHHTELRRRDALVISFFCGIISIMFLFFLFFISIRGSDGNYVQHIYEWASTFPLFRFSLVLIFVVAAAAADMKILKLNKVNFQYIFGLDPNYRITQVQLLRVVVVLFAIWFFCFTCTLMETQLTFIFPEPTMYFCSILVIAFALICLLPVHCFYARARWALA